MSKTKRRKIVKIDVEKIRGLHKIQMGKIRKKREVIRVIFSLLFTIAGIVALYRRQRMLALLMFFGVGTSLFAPWSIFEAAGQLINACVLIAYIVHQTLGIMLGKHTQMSSTKP